MNPGYKYMKLNYALITLFITFFLLFCGCSLPKNSVVNGSVDDADAKSIEIEHIDSDNTSFNNDESLNNEDVNKNQTEEDSLEKPNVDEVFYISDIPDDIFSIMQGKSYKEGCPIDREELRYLHIIHIGFDNKEHEGEIICNKIIAEKLLEIFKELYVNQYQIEKVTLVDYYDADDEQSMRDNNTSCFNYRQISNSNKISKHGRGIAVDINPLYNPCVKNVKGKTIIEPETAEPYVDRNISFEHKMDKDDLCVRLFKKYGFIWGGEFNSLKDYQHFELP